MIKDQIHDLSVEVNNISEMVKAYIALIEPNHVALVPIDTDMICNGLCGIVNHLDRIAVDLDEMWLSLRAVAKEGSETE